jgi:transposase-like protein
MERRVFTREFKLEAVRLIKDRGVPYVQASQDLGVHTSQLRDWVKKLADDPQHAFRDVACWHTLPKNRSQGILARA